jgi:hypothetical protein
MKVKEKMNELNTKFVSLVTPAYRQAGFRAGVKRIARMTECENA